MSAQPGAAVDLFAGSSYFGLCDASASQIADRCGVPNVPGAMILPRLVYVAANLLEPVAKHFGREPTVTSWYRSEAVERVLCWGGDNKKSPFARWCQKRALMVCETSWPAYFQTKQHPSGEAVDLKVRGVPNIEVARFCADRLVCDQVILEFNRPGDPFAGWVHASMIDEAAPENSARLGALRPRKNRRAVLTINTAGVSVGLTA
jgi:zinc D-Ala-D-Ala carboxypeptidase